MDRKSKINSENLYRSVIDFMQILKVFWNYCNNCLKGGLFPGDVNGDFAHFLSF